MSKVMKAALIHNFDGIEKVVIKDILLPTPKDNEVQIQIKYAGVNPVDWKIAEGLLKNRMNYEFPLILGWDAAGIISAKGKNVKNLKEGDSVFAFCRKNILHDGSYAEYICLDHQNVVLKPKSLSFAEASSIPLSSLTAWQALYETAKIKKDHTVLIHAGAGGVGGFAIQLAKIIKARVLTTASHSNFDYVKNLGAEEIIDYTKENFVDYVRKKYPKGIDIAFDTVGGNTLAATYGILKEGGSLITITGIIDQALANQHSLKAEFVFVQPNGIQLKKIAELFDELKMHTPHIQEIPFEDVILALRKSREGHTQGKLVIKIS